MSAVVSIVLVVAAAIFVAWPFLRKEETGPFSEDSLSPLERQKVEAYSAIKEAEFDLRMGKLSEEDFGILEQKYRQQALEAITAIEKSKEAIQPRHEPEGDRSRRIAFCPACGNRVPLRANFCGGCGSSLREQAA